jgi:hypothetical protein
VNVSLHFVQPDAVATDKGILIIDLSKIISHDLVIRENPRQLPPFLLVIFADGYDNTFAHRERKEGEIGGSVSDLYVVDVVERHRLMGLHNNA